MLQFKVACVAPLLFLCAFAVPARAADKPDPSGTWKWKREVEGTSVESVLKLKLDKDKLTGTYSRGDVKAEIKNGKLGGDQVSFDVSATINDNDVTLSFKGKLDKDAIKGKVNLSAGGQSGELDWEAKRGLDFEDVVGKWQIRVETPDRVFEPVLVLNIDKDKKPAGTYQTQEIGEFKLEDIAIKDADLHFKINGQQDDNKFTIAYAARPAGDSMKGTVKITFNENPFDLEFTAKRLPEEQKVKPAEKK
jgi:hypothetical protein